MVSHPFTFYATLRLCLMIAADDARETGKPRAVVDRFVAAADVCKGAAPRVEVET